MREQTNYNILTQNRVIFVFSFTKHDLLIFVYLNLIDYSTTKVDRIYEYLITLYC